MRLATLTGALVGALLLSSAGLAAAGPAAAAPGDGKNVTYRGTTLRVPASWPVIDLDAAPNTCVRFDRHAVYLGSPERTRTARPTCGGAARRSWSGRPCPERRAGPGRTPPPARSR